MRNISPVITELLEKRGITGEAEINEFLAEKPKKTYDPFLLPDMEAGVDLILDAIKNDRRICIYGDYDADGVTSVSILMEFLGYLTNNLEYYIPMRIEEGYGLNRDAVRTIHERGVDLLITVDCGSVSYEEVELAKELGMDVLVTDHHSITDVRADCLMINPKRNDCVYPYRDLAGCGVAFKLAQALQKKADVPRTVLNRALDLVALGTIADVVPLLDENRTMVKHGMNIIRSGHRQGMAHLIKSISFDREALRSDHIAFGIAPHINAAGRMGDASVAVNVMLGKEKAGIESDVNRLVQYNAERKSIQSKAFDKCSQTVERGYLDKPIIVLYMDDIHEGIAGIVAGKLKDKYGRPVIIATDSDGGVKGTGRSVPGVNLYELLHTYENMFTKFGGHEGACGFSMEYGRLSELAALLEEDMYRRLDDDPELLAVKIPVDMELEGGLATLELAKELDLLAPFGSKNPKPNFMLRQVDIEKVAYMGDGRHARFTAVCPDGHDVECVLFGKAESFQEELYSGIPMDIVGTLDWQEWRGKERVRFTVEDIRWEEI